MRRKIIENPRQREIKKVKDKKYEPSCLSEREKKNILFDTFVLKRSEDSAQDALKISHVQSARTRLFLRRRLDESLECIYIAGAGTPPSRGRRDEKKQGSRCAVLLLRFFACMRFSTREYHASASVRFRDRHSSYMVHKFIIAMARLIYAGKKSTGFDFSLRMSLSFWEKIHHVRSAAEYCNKNLYLCIGTTHTAFA